MNIFSHVQILFWIRIFFIPIGNKIQNGWFNEVKATVKTGTKGLTKLDYKYNLTQDDA